MGTYWQIEEGQINNDSLGTDHHKREGKYNK